MTPLASLRGHARLLLLAVMLALAAPAAFAAGSDASGHSAVESGPAGGPGVEGFEEGVHAAEHGGGLPQLDAATFPSQIFWLIVSFLALYWLFSRKALPRVGEILEARQERISADLDRAAALRAEAEAALRKHEAVVAEAQARAAAQLKETQDRINAEAAKRQAELDAELHAKLAEAEQRIGAAKDAALAQIQGVAGEVAKAAVQRLTGIEVAAQEVEATVKRVLGEAA
jgi:F-type H+-transporting ATPase subunit b